jgi:Flp pilus assembly protein TadD
MSLRSRFRLICFLAFIITTCFSGLTPLFAGEPQWVEVRSPNFSVVTDAGEKRGREIAMRFEQMRGVFGSLMTKANVNLAIPLQIVAFRNTKELRQVSPLFNGKPTELSGLFQGGSDRSFIMLDSSVENPWVVVFHEYAHQLMNGNLQYEFDPWFEEGFAEYFSSIEVDSKEARVGKIPGDEYLILQQSGTMKIADLLRVRQNSSTYNESGDHRNTFYAESGMLMHYIYDNKLLPQVITYFDLSENKHVPVEDAIQQAFGMPAPQLDKALRNYISSGHYLFYKIPNPPNISPNTYTATPLSNENAKAVLADIHLHSRDYQARAVSEFEEILKSDPNNAAACRGLGYAYLQKQDFTQAADYFKRASALDSKDPRVHYYNAMLMMRVHGLGNSPDLPAMSQELETSISLDPTFADSYALLAFAQSTSGDNPKAIASLQKAIAISPRNENYQLNLAGLYLSNRQPEQATPLLESLNKASDPRIAAQANSMLAEVQQMREMIKADAQYTEESSSGKDVSATLQHRNTVSASSVTVAAAPVHPAAAKFLQGTLTSIDCTTAPSALLTVVSGAKTWKMTVGDRKHLVLIGADEFSCSWAKRKVAVNYHETSAGEGSVISLEVQ